MSDNQHDETDLKQEKDKPPTSTKNDDKIYIEELRLRYNFWKFLLGSVVVVLITAILNFAIGWTQLRFDQQQKQQELEALRLQNEREFLAKFIEQAMDVNLEARIRFSHYFASLTDSEGQGHRWKNYHSTLLATATSESSELAIKKSTALAIEVKQATSTAEAKATMTYVAEQLEENPEGFSPTATRVALELSDQATKLQEARLEIQQEVQRLENELTRQKTPTIVPRPLSLSTSPIDVQCGEIIQGEFIENAETLDFSIQLSAGDRILIEGDQLGNHLRYVIGLFSPTGLNLAMSGEYSDSYGNGHLVSQSPILESNVLSASGRYIIRSTNTKLLYGGGVLANNSFYGGVGSYILSIKCFLADGTIIEGGRLDVQ